MANTPVGKKRPPTSTPPAPRPPARVQPPRKPSATQARADAAARKRTRILYAGIASGLVVVLVVVLIVVKAAGGSSKSTNVAAGTSVGTPTPATVTSALASIPPSQLAAAMQSAGNAVPAPTTINGPSLAANGKPGILYIGAGYCPYCAAERWAIVTALSQFGTFSGLSDSHSSSADVNPNTPTFSFHGSSYTSPYLTFTAVEQTTSDPTVRLDTPTPAQVALIQRYSNGSIPFVYFDGRYLVNGAQFNGKLLAGLTVEQVAAQAANPSTRIGEAVQASAATIVQALCHLTGGKPGNVCNAFPSTGA
ncbi:MAG TPA: DUF929 family protein [Acidimicrobiales bacterium]|nr:DUF929 family protein [Acidimicrobiales bacterium]